MSGQNSQSQSAGYVGKASQFTGGGSLYNAFEFMIRQVIEGRASSGLVEVVKVHGGGPSGRCSVDVKPLIDQVDGLGNRTPHGTVYNIPVFRYQSGSVAFIADPVVGDHGHAIICDRDISAWKRTGTSAAPASARSGSWSDGIFYGSVSDSAPTTYIHQSPTGIEIKTSMNITIDAQNLKLDSSGNLKAKGEITSFDGGPSVTSSQHRHGGGVVPTPGT